MKLKPFTDLIDVFGKVARGLKTRANLHIAEKTRAEHCFRDSKQK